MEQLVVSWIEYDIRNLILANDFGTWPTPSHNVFNAECEANCVDGMLLPRSLNHEGGMETIRAIDILTAYQDKQDEMEQFKFYQKATKRYNKQQSG